MSNNRESWRLMLKTGQGVKMTKRVGVRVMVSLAKFQSLLLSMEEKIFRL
jgi:hypothetical protein